MLKKDPKDRPTATKLLHHSLIRDKLIKFGLDDFINDQKRISNLMATIVIPKNLSKLSDHLPKKRKHKRA